jgi:hypothetical protein
VLSLQVYLTSLVIEVGLNYARAEDVIEENKKQIEEYGSRLLPAEVGFYMRRHPQNILQTGNDRVCLVTGIIKQANDGGSGSKDCLLRYPWSRNATKSLFQDIKTQWKLIKNEATAARLWKFWHGCTPATAASRALRRHERPGAGRLSSDVLLLLPLL